MKNQLSVLSVALAACFSMNVQGQNIYDDFDNYEPGPLTTQTDQWITWDMNPGGGMECFVVEEEFASAPHSLRVAEGGVEDVILLLGDDYSSGAINIGWNMLIPAGKTAYYNHQSSETPGVGWNFNVYFNENGNSPGIAAIKLGNTVLGTFSYPEGEWFSVLHDIDLDAALMDVYINDLPVYTTAMYFNTLGGVNFYSINNNNRYYIDDVVAEFETEDPTSTAGHLLHNVSIFPNPATTHFQVNLNGLENEVHMQMYDLSGKLLRNETLVGNELHTLALNGLNSGLYMVNLSSEKFERNFKLIVR
ncbi:MAG: T9SS C-terminal target domain-containing protein [Cryomorphaceae bacterium]|nr:MAG: T9SS C-terminal target domain-containing protein [Cryomorphaceae bacterium]